MSKRYSGKSFKDSFLDIINSTTFKKYINKKENINIKYESIYLESVNIYNDMNKYSIQ